MTRLIAVLALALLLVGCSSPDDDIGAPEAPGDGTPIEITLTSYEIEIGGDVPAGTITFDITNDGDHDHGFAIEGNGRDETIVPVIEPGSETQATIDLEAGTYTVYCPIGDHRDRGMEAQLTVTESGG